MHLRAPHFRGLGLALVLVLALPLAAAAQVGTTTDIITGRVLGPAGMPVAGAQVEAVSLETQTRRRTLTNNQGRYTIIFPDGGGRYALQVSFIGMAPNQFVLARQADEEVLVADVQLDTEAIAIQGIEVTARRAPDDRIQREPGSQERVLTGEALNRLPIDPEDFAALAGLTPGVVGLEGADTLGLGAGFSIMGQRPDLNSITLDGMSFGSMMGGGMDGGIPQEAVRMTRIITNTYDVARGQFAGGQIATTTRRGTNQTQGSFSYMLRDPALQWSLPGSLSEGNAQHRFSGGGGGPIIRDRLFYFGSISANRRTSPFQTLNTLDPAALERLGLTADSRTSFFNAVQDQHGIPLTLGPALSDRTTDSYVLLGRLDMRLNDRHTLMLRGDGRLSQQDGLRAGPLGLPQNGGEMESHSVGGMAMLTSHLGTGWINEFRAYMSQQERSSEPYVYLPEGRVRISSELADGTRGISTLTFGGNRSLPSSSEERTVELSNEVSYLIGNRHRIRIGGLLNHTLFEQTSSMNQLGTYTYNSLEDLEAGRPASFTRTLTPRVREGSGMNAAFYAGNTWRPVQRLQITGGLRAEASAFNATPEHNPAVEELFGLHTNYMPTEFHVSPRVGFSWTIGGGRGTPALGVLRGGFGEFRGRTPFGIFSSVMEGTGLEGSEVQLYCVGRSVPTPDWGAYLTDRSAIPTACAGEASPLPSSGRAPNVTVLEDGFGAPRNWRASLGFQRRVMQLFSLSLDANHARGINLYGVRDLNLSTEPQFYLASEDGRPVYADPAAIVGSTGQVPFFATRQHGEFGHVFQLSSDLQSRTTQFTIGLGGMIPLVRNPLQTDMLRLMQARRVMFNTSYTYSRSEDQSSFSCCSALQGFASASTAADPNRTEWATSDMERRHSIITTLSTQISPAVNISLIGRLSSGAPFTPMVGGDINGDGVRNDRAFIFDPAAATTDAAVAAGLTRLLETAPERVRQCLESQLGQVAGRNSCQGEWSQSLDLRSSIQPELPRIGRRFTLSVDAMNLLGGLDRVVHGTEDMRGWGQPRRADRTLLYPRGFDAETQSFRYEVNELFGSPRQQRNLFGSPFQVQITGRMAVGAAPRGGFGGMGGMMGGMGGGRGGPRAAAAAGGSQADGFDPSAMLNRALANPVTAILALRDTLALTEEQVVKLQEVESSLQQKTDEIVAAVREQAEGGAAGRDPMAVMRTLQPRLAEARTARQEALQAVQEVLTEEQWTQVPAEIRNPQQQFRGGTRRQ